MRCSRLLSLAASAGALCTFTVARVHAVPPQYTVTVLADGGSGYPDKPFGINSSGQVAGTLGYSAAAVWNNGPMQTIVASGGGGGGFYTYAYAINATGLVVGFSPQPDALAYWGEVNRAMVWNVNAPGTSTVLGDFGNNNDFASIAYAINASGLVVGNAPSQAGDATYAVLWNVNSPGTPTILGSLGGTSSSANAINDSGLIAGYSYTTNIYGANVTQEAVLWNVNTPGSPSVLGSLGGTAGSVANAINASGVVVGSSYSLGNTAQYSVMWRGATLTVLGSLGGNNSAAAAINDSGDVVGYSTLPGQESTTHGFLYTGGTMYDLTTLIPAGDVSIIGASGINNRGQICAIGYGSPYGGEAALLLTPITTLQSWRQKYFGTTEGTGNAADAADPYGTGVPNLLVYALLGPYQDPATLKRSQLPQPQLTWPYLSYSFTEPPGVTGVNYVAEWSTTLLPGSWTAITDAGTWTNHSFTIGAGGAQTFIRLRVTTQ